jgi:hypothetical protein
MQMHGQQNAIRRNEKEKVLVGKRNLNMLKFRQFILEKLDSENPDIVIDKIGHDGLTSGNLYDSTPLTGGRRRTRKGQNPEHPIVSAIQKLSSTNGNSDVVFKINHGDTTHTVQIPPVEGEHAKGRVDFSHEITQGDETTTEHHELKLKSTPKTALGRGSERLIKRLEEIPSSGTLRRKVDKEEAEIILKRFIRRKFNMPKITDKDKRYLSISTVKDHGLLHPDPVIHGRIVDEIKKLPKNKQKLVHQALRLMYERITAHTTPEEKIESEFHSTDLDNNREIEKLSSYYSDRMSYMGGKHTYISVETGNQNDHAVIQVDRQDIPTLQHHLENNLPLERNHPLYSTYIKKITPKKTNIGTSHEDALKIIDNTRKKLEVNTRTLPK